MTNRNEREDVRNRQQNGGRDNGDRQPGQQQQAQQEKQGMAAKEHGLLRET
ncbi:MAG: hypothetical protein KDE29_14700 [Anaerolineales bacterium]|nr:hypothetical protein [Anaerolineales bacterium]